MSEFSRPCATCGHSSDFHSFKDGTNGGSTDVTSPDALFSCNGEQFKGCEFECSNFVDEPGWEPVLKG